MPEKLMKEILKGGKKVEITLGRYTLNAENGTSTLVQSGSNYTETETILIIIKKHRHNQMEE